VALHAGDPPARLVFDSLGAVSQGYSDCHGHLWWFLLFGFANDSKRLKPAVSLCSSVFIVLAVPRVIRCPPWRCANGGGRGCLFTTTITIGARLIVYEVLDLRKKVGAWID
jgi:hypothetical protein